MDIEKRKQDSSSETRVAAPNDEPAFRRALFKLDFIFLPAVTFIYFLNFLDRSNIGNAKAAGLLTDLNITSRQYSIALTVTYVPYIVVELPLTLLIKKVGPNILLPTLVVLWGIVTTFQGFVHDYHGLLIARFFLGCTEGAILPSSMAYLSTFYRRGDLAKRVALFFSATSLAGAFSGLLASAILNMAGIRGMKGWQWLFIIEGIFTCVYGFIAFAILPRAPTTAWFLSQPEKDALVAALAVDRPPAEDEQKLTLRAVLDVFSAPHMWNMALQFFSSGAMLYASAYFAPTIVGAIGYKGIKVQLYSVPPYVCSAAFALGSCWLSDYLKLRGPFIMLAAIVSVIGYAMFLGSTNPKTLYAALFLQVMGAYAVAPLQSTWMPNNLAPFYRRVTGITMGFVATNSGGILSTWLFPTNEAPRYHRGTSVLLGLSAAICFWTVLNMLYLHHQNRKRAAANGVEEDNSDVNDGVLGDRSVHFKYIL